jgi:chromosome segregation ATPase
MERETMTDTTGKEIVTLIGQVDQLLKDDTDYTNRIKDLEDDKKAMAMEHGKTLKDLDEAETEIEKKKEYEEMLRTEIRKLKAENEKSRKCEICKTFAKEFWKREAIKKNKRIKKLEDKNKELKCKQTSFEVEEDRNHGEIIRLQRKVRELEASSLTKADARGIINGCETWLLSEEEKKHLIKRFDAFFARKGVDVGAVK